MRYIYVLCVAFLFAGADALGMNSSRFEQESASFNYNNFPLEVAFINIHGRKSMQEDVVFLNTSLAEKKSTMIAAVFDGNGGIGAKSIQDDLIKRLSDNFVRIKDIADVNSCFLNVNDKLKNIELKDGLHNWEYAGSTALIFFALQEKFCLAWCGDSEAIFNKKDKMFFTRPHHLEKRAGPYSFYRSFGNFHANSSENFFLKGNNNIPMTSNPDTCTIDPLETNWILLATDGLWADTNKKEVFDIINALRLKGEFNTVIVQKVLLVGILNDISNNLVNTLIARMFKEYKKIQYPSLRSPKVTEQSCLDFFNEYRANLLNLLENLQITFNVNDNFLQSPLSSKELIQQEEAPLLKVLCEDIVSLKDIDFTQSFEHVTKAIKAIFYSIPDNDRKKLFSLYIQLEDADSLNSALEEWFKNDKVRSLDHGKRLIRNEYKFLNDMSRFVNDIRDKIKKRKSDTIYYGKDNINLNSYIEVLEKYTADNTAIVYIGMKDLIESKEKLVTIEPLETGQSMVLGNSEKPEGGVSNFFTNILTNIKDFFSNLLLVIYNNFLD